MTSVNQLFDQYYIRYFSGNTASDLTKYSAYIYCFNGNSTIGKLFFYPEHFRLPADSLRNGLVELHFHERYLSNIIDTLRFEKPLYLYYSEASKHGWISTISEAVGEEES